MKGKYRWLLLVFMVGACASYEKFRDVTQELEIPSKIFRAPYNQSWQALIQVMKKYDIAQQNQEAGYIKTRWMDNTLQVNFTDSFGTNDAVKAAKFKLVVNVVKAYSGQKKSLKSVFINAN
jgi:uncharacterized lipoprotein